MAKKHGLRRKAHFLGTKIKSLRKRHNLTLEDLSIRCIQIDAEAGPSVSYLSMIENGKRTPSERLLQIVSEIFQKEVSWFYDEAMDDPPLIRHDWTRPSPACRSNRAFCFPNHCCKRRFLSYSRRREQPAGSSLTC